MGFYRQNSFAFFFSFLPNYALMVQDHLFQLEQYFHSDKKWLNSRLCASSILSQPTCVKRRSKKIHGVQQQISQCCFGVPFSSSILLTRKSELLPCSPPYLLYLNTIINTQFNVENVSQVKFLFFFLLVANIRLYLLFFPQHVLKKLLAITELLQQKQNQYSVSNNIRQQPST